MSRRGPTLLLAAVLATGAILAAVVVAVGSRQPAPPEAARPSPPDARLEADLRRQHEAIAELRAAVARLEEQVGKLAAGLELAPPPPAEAPEPDPANADGLSSGSPALEAAASWLRSFLPPDRVDLSPEEAAHLRELELHGAEVTDADLEHLAALTNLRSLSLRETAVTDAGLGHLQRLSRLESLDLRGEKVQGPGLRHLPSGLLDLDLSDTKVSTSRLAHLPRLPSLESLDLNRLPIDDAAIEILRSYPSLRRLELDGTAVTDAGLRRLLEVNPALERIEVRGTAVTRAAILELSEAYPGLTVVHDSAGPPGF
ncbi:MAG: hypothetical protein HY721_10635 [Planctomycetes bacterium]|nr:hypothetical protein [Planctomycetota bacterium]